MDYARYSLGHYLDSMWIECTECGKADKPVFVWQRHERATNLILPVSAVMHHEIAAHASNPVAKLRK